MHTCMHLCVCMHAFYVIAHVYVHKSCGVCIRMHACIEIYIRITSPVHSCSIHSHLCAPYLTVSTAIFAYNTLSA